MLPSVGIIITIYNAEKTLRRCIDSVLNQDYSNIVLCLVDDGSSDKSGKICDEYGSQFSNIQVIHKQNEGCSRARLSGIRTIKTDLVGFIDSDDWIEPETISEMMSGYDISTDIIVGGYVEDRGSIKNIFVKSEERVLDTNSALYELFSNRIFNWSMCDKLYKRDIFNNLNDDDYMTNSYGEDTYKNYILFKNAKRVVYKPIYKYHYCLNTEGMMHKPFDKNKYIYIDIYRSIKKDAISLGNEGLIGLIDSLLLDVGLLRLREALSVYGSGDCDFKRYLGYLRQELKSAKNTSAMREKYSYRFEWLDNYDRNIKAYKELLLMISKEYDCLWLYGAGVIANEAMQILDEFNINYKIVVTQIQKNNICTKKDLFEFNAIKSTINKNDCIMLAMNRANSEEVKQQQWLEGTYNIQDIGKNSFYYI